MIVWNPPWVFFKVARESLQQICLHGFEARVILGKLVDPAVKACRKLCVKAYCAELQGSMQVNMHTESPLWCTRALANKELLMPNCPYWRMSDQPIPHVSTIYGLPTAADINNHAYKVGGVSMIIKRDYTIRNWGQVTESGRGWWGCLTVLVRRRWKQRYLLLHQTSTAHCMHPYTL